MAVRSAVGIVNQIGVETTPGTLVAANRYTPTLNWNLKRTIETKNFRARGSRVNTTKVQHKRMAEGSVEGVLDYNSIIYLLSGLFNDPSPSQIGALQAYERIYTPGVRTADSSRKTYSLECGDATAAEKYAFLQLLGLNLQAQQDDFTVSSNAIARYPVDNASLTASPVEVAERPVQRADINLYMDNSFGSIGTTQITEAQSESLEIGNKFKDVFFHNRSAGEFADVVEIPYEPKFSFETAHNAQSRALVADIINNPFKWFRWEARGALLGVDNSVNIYELIQIDIAARFDAPEPLDNNDEIYAYKYNLEGMPDTAGLTSYMKVKVVNGRATL